MFGIEPQYIIALLLFLCIMVVIFFIIRDIVCWYFRINEHIHDQYQHLVVLKKILAILEQQEIRANAAHFAELVPQLPPKPAEKKAETATTVHE